MKTRFSLIVGMVIGILISMLFSIFTVNTQDTPHTRGGGIPEIPLCVTETPKVVENIFGITATSGVIPKITSTSVFFTHTPGITVIPTNTFIVPTSTAIPPTEISPTEIPATEKVNCNNGKGNGSEGCSPSEHGNDDESP